MKVKSGSLKMYLCIAGGLLAVLLPILTTAQEAGPFERRCGQCHQLSDPNVQVPQAWLERLGGQGTLDQLSAEEQRQLLSFFQHHGQETSAIVAMARDRRLFEEKCSLCHNPNRVFIQTLTDDQLAAIIERMRARAPDWISREEARTIYDFLEAGAPGESRILRQEFPNDNKGLYRNRCSACHTLERVYLMLERDRERAQWALTVKRMQARAPEWITDEEADRITAYLETLEPQLEPGQLPPRVE
ncbi:MAG: cytochrome c [Xanthomonadales bacterium]|nr:cytochrome c [Xanthomonadales bacterium]